MYTTGTGGPDSEGVTKAAFGSPGVYVSTERDNTNNRREPPERAALRRQRVATATLTRDARLEPEPLDLPVADANLGLEAITWVPDSVPDRARASSTRARTRLTIPSRYAQPRGRHLLRRSRGKRDDLRLRAGSRGRRRSPARRDHRQRQSVDHGSLVRPRRRLLVGRVRRHLQRVARTCSTSTRARLPTLRKFYMRQGFERSSTMRNINNEGSRSRRGQVLGGFKPVFYSDDSNTNGHAIRVDSIPCGAFLN